MIRGNHVNSAFGEAEFFRPKLSYLTILLTFFILQGCAYYTYNGKSYNDTNTALKAVREHNQNLINEIEPKDIAIDKSVLVVIPNVNVIQQYGVVKQGNPNITFVNYITQTLSIAYENIFYAIQKRNIFKTVSFERVTDTRYPDIGDNDFIVWLHMDYQIAQWHIRGKQWEHEKRLYLPSTKQGTERIYAFLSDIEKNVSSNSLGKHKIIKMPEKDSDKVIMTKTGTAFFINTQGYLISNHHVVKECKSVEISNNIFKSKAIVLFADRRNDMAILKADIFPPPSIGYFRAGKGARVGDDVITIGYPLGSILGEGIKVTQGNISSMTGLSDDTSMMQMTTPIQPGNSGGPLLDKSGNIVGIVSSKLSELETIKATGSLPQNVNFAIKSQTVQLFLDTHGVNYLSNNSNNKLETADIAEKARKYTLYLKCYE